MRRGTPYLERQIRRWNAQWAATASRVVPAIDDVSSRHQKILPALPPQPDCLVHGDFRFGNVMVTGEPGGNSSASTGRGGSSGGRTACSTGRRRPGAC
jgi:aminoglycoside phosphotransferase (APT) family kinase protein